MAALTIRKDRAPEELRKLAKAENCTRVARRLLAIANALSGMSRKEAAEAAGMDRQTLRDWVIRYNEHGPDGLSDRWGDGRPPGSMPMKRRNSRASSWPARSGGGWHIGLYTGGSGAHLRNAVWQDVPSCLAGQAA